MKNQLFKCCVMCGFLVAIGLLGSSCNRQGNDAGSETAADVSSAVNEPAAHAGWWCVEHGIPEADCSLCSAQAAAQCREKGDWCEEHNRAESQCFICDPSRAEKFAALYEARIGEKPPKPTE